MSPVDGAAWRSVHRSRRRPVTGTGRQYLRFAALGDSFSCALPGTGAATPPGWADILAASLGEDHDVSFCDLAEPGATTDDVRRAQAPLARDHRPNLASLVAGLQDVTRSTWDPVTVRYRLMRSADDLAWSGAVILSVRFHDHSTVLGLGRDAGRGLAYRIAELNDIYDEIDDAYGTLRIDLAEHDEVQQDSFWSQHPLHPSLVGHQFLALQFGRLLVEDGLATRLAGLEWAAAPSV